MDKAPFCTENSAADLKIKGHFTTGCRVLQPKGGDLGVDAGVSDKVHIVANVRGIGEINLLKVTEYVHIFSNINAARISTSALFFRLVSFSRKTNTLTVVITTMVPTLNTGYVMTAGTSPSANSKKRAEK